MCSMLEGKFFFFNQNVQIVLSKMEVLFLSMLGHHINPSIHHLKWQLH